ncbi:MULTISPECIES: amidohydrolase [Ruegeria]|uniref:Amidohydrolase family protein n=1 Tax=Ruegeria atlantica TaxID=81569 RepID=A0ABX1WD48_9RHOB|nr:MULTISPECIES: amidohydrolase [Ruegeria]NOD31157.1 amidohydrolase family protein [Ruegeria atlantica]
MKWMMIAVGLLTSFATNSVAQTADTVLLNGNIYTMDASRPEAEAVAIMGTQIFYVGSDDGVQSLIGEETTVIDLQGQTVLPGFVSGHEHLVASGWTQLGVQLGSGQSKEDYLKLIKEYADANPDEEFIRGIGWNATLMGGEFTAADLDTIVPDRPVFLQDYTIHDAWLNTKAMEMGGVNKDTPDPVPGLIYFVRDGEGNPTGYAKEFAWMGAYVESGAWQPDTMIPESQTELYDLAAKFGYTTYINQGLVTPNIKSQAKHYDDTRVALDILQAQADEGTLKLRTLMMTLVKGDDFDADDAVANTLELKSSFDNDDVRVLGIKIHPEGVHTSHASVMLEPWLDLPEKTAVRGVSAALTDEIVLKANAAGLDVSVHVDGSKTVRETVDSYVNAQKAGYTEARNSLQHLAFAHPDDIERIIQHNILSNITPIWGTTWGGGLDGAMEIMGLERTVSEFQRIRTLMDAGAPVSIGADVPSTDPSLMGVLTLCEAAVTRRDPSNPDDDRIFPPVYQALTLDQCIYAATLGGAYEARMEDKIGSLEFGKYADLVILEDDLFAVLPSDIADVKIVATMKGGVFTHEDGL